MPVNMVTFNTFYDLQETVDTSVRKRLKWSQDDLAKKVVTFAPIIGRHEIKPAIDTAKAIADARGVTVDFLLGRDESIMDKLLEKIGEIERFGNE